MLAIIDDGGKERPDELTNGRTNCTDVLTDWQTDRQIYVLENQGGYEDIGVESNDNNAGERSMFVTPLYPIFTLD